MSGIRQVSTCVCVCVTFRYNFSGEGGPDGKDKSKVTLHLSTSQVKRLFHRKKGQKGSWKNVLLIIHFTPENCDADEDGDDEDDEDDVSACVL